MGKWGWKMELEWEMWKIWLMTKRWSPPSGKPEVGGGKVEVEQRQLHQPPGIRNYKPNDALSGIMCRDYGRGIYAKNPRGYFICRLDSEKVC